MCPLTLDNLVVAEGAKRRHLLGVHIKKLPGPDGVSSFLLKYWAEELSRPLSLIFQQCLSTSTWPTAWKDARVTSVYKKKDKVDPTNYRPISRRLLSAKYLKE